MQLSTGFLENNRFFIFKYFQRERNKAVGVKWGEVEDKATPLLGDFQTTFDLESRLVDKGSINKNSDNSPDISRNFLLSL